jgi:hypothetical protein
MKGTIEFTAQIRLHLLQDRPWDDVKEYFLSDKRNGHGWAACIGENNKPTSSFSIVDIEGCPRSAPPTPPQVQLMVFRDNGWVGPFDTYEQATEWAKTHLDSKTAWSICALMSPSLHQPKGK